MLIILATLLVLWLGMRFYVVAMFALAAALLWAARLAARLALLALRCLGWFVLGVCRGALAELRRPRPIEAEIAVVVAQIKRGRP